MPRDRAGWIEVLIFRSLVTRILVGLPLGHHLDHESTNFIFSSGYNNTRIKIYILIVNDANLFFSFN